MKEAVFLHLIFFDACSSHPLSPDAWAQERMPTVLLIFTLLKTVAHMLHFATDYFFSPVGCFPYIIFTYVDNRAFTVHFAHYFWSVDWLLENGTWVEEDAHGTYSFCWCVYACWQRVMYRKAGVVAALLF